MHKERIDSEARRIERVYRKRYEADKERYSLFNPGEHFLDITYERDFIRSLKKAGISNLAGLKILEIGCGDGRRLRNFQRLGATPSNLYGIELLDFYVKDANLLSSNCNIRQGDASDLPYNDEEFDIVYQRTVFTSIFDEEVKKNIASEMLRVLRTNRFVIWYDFHMNNPKNPDVKGIKKREIYKLFPNCDMYLKRITLAPPLARLIAPWSFLLCYSLEKIPWLRTHYLGVIRKK